MSASLRQSPLAILLLVVGAIAGCGGTTKIVTVGPPLTSASTPARSTQSATTTPPVTTFLHISTFRSPTGNIGCVLLDGNARCDIEHRSWSPPPRPAGCPTIVDFGQGLQMQGSGTPQFVCAGDTARDPASPPLPYGEGTRVGPFECVSRSTGMTCTRPADGHGFFLSIQSYRIF